MKRSTALYESLTAFFPSLGRTGRSFRERTGVLASGPVPRSAQSEVSRSTRLGDWCDLAMFDLGESRTDVLEVAFEKRDVQLLTKSGSD